MIANSKKQTNKNKKELGYINLQPYIKRCYTTYIS